MVEPEVIGRPGVEPGLGHAARALDLVLDDPRFQIGDHGFEHFAAQLVQFVAAGGEAVGPHHRAVACSCKAVRAREAGLSNVRFEEGDASHLEALSDNSFDLVVSYDGDAALAEVDRVAARGVKLLKIHPHTQKFDAADPRVLTLVKRAGDKGLVVVMDNASIVPSDNEKLFNLALAAPKTKFIFGHMGGLGFRFWNILALARTAENLFADNVYFDISASVILAADSPVEAEYVWTIRNVGVDHVLLASDFPQISLPKTLEAVAKLDLTEEERAKIRSGNARKLLGL